MRGPAPDFFQAYRQGETLETLGFAPSLDPPAVLLYQVMAPINVQQGVALGHPELDAPGGGIVYNLGQAQTIQSLIDQRKLKEIGREE